MLIGINQRDPRLLKVIQKYGCLFLCFAYASPIVFEGENGIEVLNHLWATAEDTGAINGDLNSDGDYDDLMEAEVKDHDKLATLFRLPVKYDGQHHLPQDKIPEKVKVVFGCYFWKGTHFVVLNKNLEIVHDPLGESNTVKNGYLRNVRWYYYAD